MSKPLASAHVAISSAAAYEPLRLRRVEPGRPHVESDDGHRHGESVSSSTGPHVEPRDPPRLEHVLVTSAHAPDRRALRFSHTGCGARQSGRRSRHRGPTEGEPCPKPSSSPPPARPIGRANKGSLVDVRPDDLARHRRRTCSPKVPGARSAASSRTSSWAAASPAARPATTSAAWPRSSPACPTSPASRSTATARRRCRPSAWPPTPSRPARATSSSPPASRP